MIFYFFFNIFCYLKIHVFFILTLLPFSYHMVLSSIHSSTRRETPHDAPPRIVVSISLDFLICALSQDLNFRSDGLKGEQD